MVISQPPPSVGGGMNHPPQSMGSQGQGPPGGGSGDGQNVFDFDGKRMRKTMMRKTIDYNSSFLNMLQDRIWQRDYRDRRALQPDICYYPAIVPPQQLLDNPVNCVTTRFIKTATNKMRCPIFCLSWTPDGRRLITGASSGEFTLWNGLTFNFETILQAHDSPVRAMKWSYNANWMVTGDHGGYIKYWQSNMNNVKMFQAHKEPVRQVSFSPSDTKFASCSDDGTVRIWDFQKCMEERVLRGHGSDVKCCDWHPQKGIIVSGSKDNQQPIKLWDPRNGMVLATIHAHKSTVMDCQWNKNGNWLVTASRDHLLKLFDIRNMKEEMQTFRGHKKEASSVAWHPVHEGMFSSGGSDGSIIFWNVDQEKEVGSIEQAHDSIVWTSVWHPIGHILTTGSNDHTVKFWSRNRPGDLMRDKYNLNTLNPPVEDDQGNIGDLPTQPGVTNTAPGAIGDARSTKSDLKLSIPGLDVQCMADEPKIARSKPSSRTFPALNSVPDRGTKRLYGERESSGFSVSSHAPLPQQQQAAEAQPKPSTAITLSQLQQEATAVVAQGQVVPVLPGGQLYQAIGAGEMAIREVLLREFSIGAVKTETKQFQYGYPKPEKDGPPPSHIPPPGYAGGPGLGPPPSHGPPHGHGLPQGGHRGGHYGHGGPPHGNQGHNMGGPPPHWGGHYDRGRRDDRDDGYGGGGGRRNNWGRGRGRM